MVSVFLKLMRKVTLFIYNRNNILNTLVGCFSGSIYLWSGNII